MKRIIIVALALAVSGLVLWNHLPIEFPMIMYKVFMLFLKLFVVLALAVFAYMLTGTKKA